jgi:hypothetical protein
LPQVSFIKALKTKSLLELNVSSKLIGKIHDLCSHSRFAGNITINDELDSSKLNFYIINSERDSSLKNVCAYIGCNTILLDNTFLQSFLDKDSFFLTLSEKDRECIYSSFQTWVIGHEIAHAELKHSVSHFVSYRKPKTSEEGLQFHQLEIAADERSITYSNEQYPDLREKMLLRLFQVDYDSLYGAEPNSPNKYLKYYDEFGLQRTYTFKGIGSHPLMLYRSALLLLLTSKNQTIKDEAYIFLIEINAFNSVRQWKPSDKRNVKIPAFTR